MSEIIFPEKIKVEMERTDEIYIHDTLISNGKLSLGEEISEETMNDFRKDLLWCSLEGIRNIEIQICSPGGSIFNGLAIFDMIRRFMYEFGLNVTTIGEGFQASMGSILLQAGTIRKVTKFSWCMIHQPSSIAIGETEKIFDEAKLLKRLQGKFLDIYTERSKLSRKIIQSNWKRKDWWLDSEQLLEKELVDEVIDTSWKGRIK